MNHPSRVIYRHIFYLVVFLWLNGATGATAGDAWSPGTSSEAWQRINRLQSVGQPARVRSAFVTQCLESEYAVERAAAVCWVARTGSASHASDLEKRLSDESAEVQQLAWNALLQLPDAAAAQIVLRTLETKAELPKEFQFSMGMASGIIADGPLAKRQAWLASLGDRAAWVKTYVKQKLEDPLMSKLPAVELKSSIVSNEGDVKFAVKPLESQLHRVQPLRANMSGLILEADVSGSRLARDYPRMKFAEIKDGGLQVRLLEKQTLSPGVYSLAVETEQRGMGSGTALHWFFPFFLRIHRTAVQEQEIQQMLEEPLNSSSVVRLGVLRAEAAVPKLIEYFESHQECDQASAGHALAMIGDARAASVFLKTPSWHCQDSGWICFQEFFQLAPPTRDISDQKVVEIGSHLVEQWSKLSDVEQSTAVTGMQLALYRCHRPLSHAQKQVIEQAIERFKQKADEAPEKERIYHYMSVAPLVVAYVADDPQSLKDWLRVNQDQPDLILEFVRELTWPARKENTRFPYPSKFWQAMLDELTTWKKSVKLNADKTARLTRSIVEVESLSKNPNGI